jgi:hypothetical protein
VHGSQAGLNIVSFVSGIETAVVGIGAGKMIISKGLALTGTISPEALVATLRDYDPNRCSSTIHLDAILVLLSRNHLIHKRD